MPDGKCRRRVVARVVSTLNQLIQLRSTSGTVDFFTSLLLMRLKKRYHPLHVATADMDGVYLPKPWPHSNQHGQRGRMRNTPCVPTPGIEPRGRR